MAKVELRNGPKRVECSIWSLDIGPQSGETGLRRPFRGFVRLQFGACADFSGSFIARFYPFTPRSKASRLGVPRTHAALLPCPFLGAPRKKSSVPTTPASP